VVIATHPHQALRILTEPSRAERDLLGAIDYTVNPAVLHTDASVLPRAPRAQASWNYVLPSCEAVPTTVPVSYNMNRLQRLDAPQTYVVTLNGDDRIDPDTVIDRMSYEHPVYTTASVAARERLPELNDGVLAFAGAYHGWGFHEDGCRSGVAAAASLGVRW
jgi:predicted NAD/FAD-binding protein